MKWVYANADTLHIDRKRIIIAGESGGGNFTLATGLKLKRDGDINLIKELWVADEEGDGAGYDVLSYEFGRPGTTA